MALHPGGTPAAFYKLQSRSLIGQVSIPPNAVPTVPCDARSALHCLELCGTARNCAALLCAAPPATVLHRPLAATASIFEEGMLPGAKVREGVRSCKGPARLYPSWPSDLKSQGLKPTWVCLCSMPQSTTRSNNRLFGDADQESA
eukprot:364847-Chlamydomonas_euryale.AAC.4